MIDIKHSPICGRSKRLRWYQRINVSTTSGHRSGVGLRLPRRTPPCNTEHGRYTRARVLLSESLAAVVSIRIPFWLPASLPFTRESGDSTAPIHLSVSDHFLRPHNRPTSRLLKSPLLVAHARIPWVSAQSAQHTNIQVHISPCKFLKAFNKVSCAFCEGFNK